MNPEGKVVLISGAREGIGAACAREFLRRGARLSLIDISPEPADYSDGGALWTIGDITNPEVRVAAVTSTIEKLGSVDILINNAAIGLYSSPSATPPALAERMFAVNVSAAVGLAGLVIPHMRARRSGAIINIESIGSLVSLPWCSMYCASKHALRAYTRSLHHELKRDGILVVSVIPGIVNTRFRDNVLGGIVPAGVASLKRAIEPEDLACSIAHALVKEKREIFNPRIGRLFWALELCLPGLMHLYLRRCWTPPRGEAPPAGQSALKGESYVE
jgi:NAD(P)-dependent dehydrogenase (short-subunit alcohol dehydrogenase family)